MTRFAILLAVAFALGAPVAHAADAAWKPLVSAAEAEALIGDGAVVIDIRAPEDFAAGHVAGAVSLPYPAWRGPAENPGALVEGKAVEALLRKAGATPDSTVVVLNEGRDSLDFGAAARVYWTVKSAGIARVAILNGGLAAWQGAGLALTAVTREPAPSAAGFALSDAWTIDRSGVEAVIAGTREAILVDARPEDFFTGKTKHKLASWAGTLTGALNLPHETFFTAPGVLNADPEAVRAAAVAAGWQPGGPELVSFCNTGHWAATNWFALSEIAGIEGVRLYPESMVGWTRTHAQTN